MQQEQKKELSKEKAVENIVEVKRTSDDLSATPDSIKQHKDANDDSYMVG